MSCAIWRSRFDRGGHGNKQPAAPSRPFLAASFAIAAVIEILASRYIYARFREWQYSRQFYRVMGVLQLFAAFLLAARQLRIWGIILAGFIMFFWIVILLNHRRWSWAAAGMLMMAALVPASLAVQ